MIIEVADNGPGMPEEVVEQLLNPTRACRSVPEPKGSGIGFRNVHQRHPADLRQRLRPDHSQRAGQRHCRADPPACTGGRGGPAVPEGGGGDEARKVIYCSWCFPWSGTERAVLAAGLSCPVISMTSAALLEMSVILRETETAPVVRHPPGHGAGGQGSECGAAVPDPERRTTVPLNSVQLLEHEVSGAAPAVCCWYRRTGRRWAEAVSAAAAEAVPLVTVETDMTAWAALMPLSAWTTRHWARCWAKRR